MQGRVVERVGGRSPAAAGDGGPAPERIEVGGGERPSGPWAWTLALGAALAWALASAVLMPRGPVSTAESLACLGVGLVLGLAAGYVTRSRWAMLVTPAVFVVGYELVRLPIDGPSVDGVHLSMYGAIALVTGRVFHGLVALLPMVVGAAVGAAVARRGAGRPGPERPAARLGRGARVTTTAVAGLVLLALTVVVARPASTAPITDAGGDPLPGSVAELTRLDVGGHELGLMIRGYDEANPVLLFLAGGPGGSELGAMRRHLPALEEHFTVVTWDQRGTGRSYGELDPASTLTVESSVSDTLAVTDYLRERFGQDRIYLVGQSWGTILGVLVVQQAPERFAAYLGTGQMVSPLATDTIFYEDTLAWAQETGRDELADTLGRIGPPPYAETLNYETVLSHEMDVYPYDHSANSEGSGQMSENLLVPEYSLTEQVRLLTATLDTFATMYGQIQDVDFRTTATSFEVPVFFVQGAHEAPGRAEPFSDWYPQVEAPEKGLVVLDTSGHRPLFEQPDEFVAYLTDVVLPATTS